MLKRGLIAFLVLLIFGSVRAQQEYQWCGYALIQNLPLLDNQLGILEAITPPPSASVNPYELLTYRWSLDHSEVIVQGCWTAQPSRDLVVSLLAQTEPVTQSLIDTTADILNSPAQLTPAQLSQSSDHTPPGQLGGPDLELQPPLALPLPAVVDQTNAARLYVDAELVYSLFAPDGSHEDSMLAARQYIEDNDPDWDPPDIDQ